MMTDPQVVANSLFMSWMTLVFQHWAVQNAAKPSVHWPPSTSTDYLDVHMPGEWTASNQFEQPTALAHTRVLFLTAYFAFSPAICLIIGSGCGADCKAFMTRRFLDHVDCPFDPPTLL